MGGEVDGTNDISRPGTYILFTAAAYTIRFAAEQKKER
jgi:hypothetical protein